MTRADFQSESSFLETCEGTIEDKFQKSVSDMHMTVVLSISQNDLKGEQLVLYIQKPIDALSVEMKLPNHNEIFVETACAERGCDH